MRTALLLLFATLGGAASAQQIEHLQVILVDTSFSMNDRILEAFSQVRAVVTKHPPTPQRPVVIIQYEDSVRSWRRFTDLPSALYHVSPPREGGGTNHPAGLAAALKELKGVASQPQATVSIYWIVDGTDTLYHNDILAIKKIDAFFASRQKGKLGPSINLWHWSERGISDKFLESVTNALPHGVVNTGSFEDLYKSIRTITADPKIRLVAAEGPGDSSVLRITIAPSLRVSAAAFSKIENFAFALRGPVQPASGPLRLVAKPNKPAALHEVHLPLTSALRKQSNLQLSFDVTATLKCSKKECTNLFPPRQLTLTVPLTPPTTIYALHGQAKLTGKPRWFNEDKLIAAYPIEVKVATVCKKSAPTRHASVSVSIEPPLGQVFTETRKAVVPQPGKPGLQTVSLELQIPVSATANPKDMLSSKLKLSIAKTPKHTKYVPHQIDVDLQQLPLPPSIVSRVTFKTNDISSPLWYEQPDVAVFLAEIDIHVDGPCSSDLVVANPPNVTRFLVSPDKIHSGHQRGRLLVAARMLPGPAKTTLAFPVRVSDPQGPLKVELPKTINLEVTGPPPLQLVAYHRRRGDTFQFSVPPSSRTTIFPVTLALDGPHLPNFTKGFYVTPRGVSPTGSARSTLSLLQPDVVECPLPSLGVDSYVTDTRHTVPMFFEPAQLTPTVLPCQRTADIIRYALLKQHLLIGFVLALGFSLPIGAFYVVRSLRTSSVSTFT